MRFGCKVVGDKYLIPMSGWSTRGSVYEIEGRVNRFIKDKFNKENIVRFVGGLLKRTGGKVRYVEVNNGRAIIQVEGSPFYWEEFIPVLQEMLPIIGLVITVVSVSLIVKSTPLWELIMLFVGLAILWYSSKTSSEIKSIEEVVEKWLK